jgi:hypothetical protein
LRSPFPVDSHRPVEIDERERRPQPLVFGLALLIGRRWWLGSVDEIDNLASREHHHIIDAIERFPEETSEAVEQGLAHVSSSTSPRADRTEPTPRGARANV